MRQPPVQKAPNSVAGGLEGSSHPAAEESPSVSSAVPTTGMTHEMLLEALPKVRRYCLSLFWRDRDPQRGEDLLQDVVARALSRAHLFKYGELVPWLCTIAHNEYVNSVRRSTRAAAFQAFPDEAQAAEGSAVSRIMLRELRARPRMREGLDLMIEYAVEDVTYADLADRHQINIGTVRSRLSRTRKALREEYAL